MACNSLLGIEPAELRSSAGKGGDAGEPSEEDGGRSASLAAEAGSGGEAGGRAIAGVSGSGTSQGGAAGFVGSGGGGSAGQSAGVGGGAATAASAGDDGRAGQSGISGAGGAIGTSGSAAAGGFTPGGMGNAGFGGTGSAGRSGARGGDTGVVTNGRAGEGGAGDPCEDVDLQNSAENCGWCGHDCLGSDCSLGTCVSTVVAHDNWDYAWDVVATDSLLFWVGGMLSYQDIVNPQLSEGFISLDQSGVELQTWNDELFVGESGEDPSTAVVGWTSLQDPYGVYGFGIETPWLAGFAADDSGLYWGSCPADSRASLRHLAFGAGSSGTPEVLVTGIPCPHVVALDDQYVWFTSEDDGGVYQIAKTALALTSAAPVVDSGQDGNRALLVADDYVYVGSWNRGNGDDPVDSIYRFSRTAPGLGVTETVAANRGRPWEFALSGDYLYWTDLGPADTTGSGTLNRVRVSSDLGRAQPLALLQFEPRGLSISGDWVYWMSHLLMGGNEVRRVAK